MWDLLGKAFFCLIVGYFSWKALMGLYSSFLGSFLRLSVDPSKMGEWAVVTGATDGIGKAYAFEMASRGLDVVLISRNPSKLEKVASEITSQHKVRTKLIDVDFTKDDIYDRIKEELSHLDIGVLINNVGMTYDVPDNFKNIPKSLITDLINCNSLSCVMMSKIVMDGMVNRKRGLIINVSSISALINVPLLSVYGASKAFVSSFSKSLEIEAREHGITVQCLNPFFVITNLSLTQKSSLLMPTARDFVKSSMKTIGHESFTAGYHLHRLQIFGIQLVQRFLPDFVLNFFIFKKLQFIRRKFLEAKVYKKNGMNGAIRSNGKKVSNGTSG